MKNANEQKPKKNYRLVVLVALLSILILLSFLTISLLSMNHTSSSNNNDAAEIAESSNSYIPISSDELGELMAQSEPVYVYIGRETCPHCAKFAPILREALSENDATVYYYDTAAARIDDDGKMTDLLDRLEVTGVPTLIKISDGIRIATLDDYESKESILRFLAM